MKIQALREPLHASDSNLAGSQFTNVNLAGATFEDINLRGATLHDVNLTGVRITNANTEGMTINGAAIHEFVHAACVSQRHFAELMPVLRVVDLQRSIDFYTGVVGMELVWRKPQDGGGETCLLREGPVTLMLSTGSHLGGQPAFTGTLYFNMADAAGMYAQVKDHVDIVWPLEDMPYGTTEFGIRDPDGYVLAFASQNCS